MLHEESFAATCNAISTLSDVILTVVTGKLAV